MSSKIYLTQIVVGIAIFLACDRIKYYPDKEYPEVNTLVLAHRAGGGEYTPYQENSLEAADYGFSAADGIEIDIQISKDKTIWLSHSASIPECNGVSYECFSETSDSQIMALDSCNGESYNYFKLDDIFALMAQKYPGKYISIDVKAWSPCSLSSINIIGDMNDMADQIIKLTEKYKLQNYVMVESETATFLDHIKKKSTGIEHYLTTLGDFERGMLLALESGYTGISFKYKFIEEINHDHVLLMHRKGLKIQLWTVNTETDIQEALSINPDFIQTDNFTYFEQLNAVSNNCNGDFAY